MSLGFSQSAFHDATLAKPASWLSDEEVANEKLRLKFDLDQIVPFEEVLKLRACPIGEIDSQPIFASPSKEKSGVLHLSEQSFVTLTAHVYRKQLLEIAENSTRSVARRWGNYSLWLRAVFTFSLLFGFFAFTFLVDQDLVVSVYVILILGLGGTRVYFVIRGSFLKTVQHTAPKDWPIVSIFVPVLYEERVVERLVTRLSKIDYPREKLDCILITEGDDRRTIQSIKRLKLPTWIRYLEVPKGDFKTKPRALNAAVPFSKGSIIGVYDAEDAPSVNQIKDAVCALSKSGGGFDCVQAPLDFYNAHTNLISRLFAIEYAMHFRGLIPYLAKKHAPIPLGGTSFFINRTVLDKIGGWDAYNVTEDAELGLLLHAMQCRVGAISSATFEEANFRPKPWVKQRSRWLKGFLQTWIALPFAHKYSFWPFFHLIGPSISFLITISLWAIILLNLMLPQLSLGHETIAGYAMVSAISVEVGLFCAAIFTTRSPHMRSLWPAAIFMPLYRILGVAALAIAIYELAIAPSSWSKTSHGVNDEEFASDIRNLQLQMR